MWKELLLKFVPKPDFADVFEEEILSYAPSSDCEVEKLQRFETEVLQQLADRIGFSGAVRSLFLYEKMNRNGKDIFIGKSASIVYSKIVSVVAGEKRFEDEFPEGDKE